MILALGFVLLITLCSIADADLSFKCNLYNSEESISTDLQGDNLNYAAFAELNPDSIYYSGGGFSTEPDCSYSHSITNNGKALESSAKTDSGELMFHSLVDSNYCGDGGKAFELSLKNVVANGFLNSHYSNPDLSVEKTTDLNMAIYSESAGIDANQVQSMGSGVTLVFDENNKETAGGDDTATADSGTSQNAVTKDITQIISVEGRDKQSKIETNLHGDVDAVWKNGVMANANDYYLGSAITGVTRGSQDRMEMVGEATGFPMQRLPPGEVDLSYKVIENEDFSAEEIEKILEDFREEQDRFKEEYPIGTNQALWYYLDQKAAANCGEQNPPEDPDLSLAGQYFNMHMLFQNG
jgi:hypothetical protein